MSAEAGIHIPRGIFLSLLLRPVRNSGTVSFPYIKQASTMTGINPIPDEFHSVTPYLFIRGASEAIEFYKQAFGAEEVFRLPMPDGKLGHAEIQIGDSHVMLADENAEAGDQSFNFRRNVRQLSDLCRECRRDLRPGIGGRRRSGTPVG